MSELWQLSASEVARLVRTRKVSAREVADAALQRLESVNPADQCNRRLPTGSGARACRLGG
jgi:Asp-tRNA(Asn)/Glu-tRNA(Gln) amidotransferase A subunit family amidase